MDVLEARVLSACGCCGDLDVEHPITKQRVRVETHDPGLGRLLESRVAAGVPVAMKLYVNPTREEQIEAIKGEMELLRAIIASRQGKTEASPVEAVARELGVRYVNLNEGYEEFKLRHLGKELHKLSTDPAAQNGV
jgi:hypothetical protein